MIKKLQEALLARKNGRNRGSSCRLLVVHLCFLPVFFFVLKRNVETSCATVWESCLFEQGSLFLFFSGALESFLLMLAQ